jgi:uncharacterized protein (TIGR04255 family)
MNTPEKTRKLGTWHKPPLVYVVAELAIAPHYGIAESIAALQRELRAEYPRTQELAEFSLPPVAFVGGGQMQATSPAQMPQPAWHMLNQENTRGVSINHRAIGLHASAYIDSKDFIERWTNVIAALSASKLEVFIERAGLRYVDLLVPSTGNDLSNYLNEGVLGPSYPPNSKITQRMWATSYTVGDFSVQAYTFAPAPPGMLLPPTLRNIGLQMPDVLANAQKHTQVGGSVGWIDTDVGRDVKKPFDGETILEEYRKMHSIASACFRGFISPLAETEWK